MPVPLVQFGATITCMHAGTAIPAPVSPRVFIDGMPAVPLAAIYAIAGCSLTPSGLPFCITGQFTIGTTRVLSAGTPLATAAGLSACIATANPMLVLETQLRVLAT